MLDYILKMAVCGGALGVIVLIFCLIRKYPVRKLVYIVVFAVYIGAFLALTLWRTPTPGLLGKFNFIPFADLARNIQKGNYHHVYQMLVNIGLYVPLGILLKIGKVRLGWALVISLGGSVVIEIIQAVLYVGSFDIDDVIMNILGTLIGYILTALIIRTKRTAVPDSV